MDTIILKINQTIKKDKNLNRTEKELLSQIQYLDNEAGCEAHNNYLADFLDKSVRTVQRIIQKLKTLGYIKYELINNFKRKLKVIVEKVGEKLDKPAKKEGMTNWRKGYAKVAGYIPNKSNLNLKKRNVVTICQLDYESVNEFELRVSEKETLYGDTIIYKKEYYCGNLTNGTDIFKDLYAKFKLSF